MEKKNWFYIAIGCIVVSILSLFTSVVAYTTGSGSHFSYSIIDLIRNDEFTDQVLWDYYGPILWNISGPTVTILSIIAILGIICAVVGLITLRAQRPNTWQFRLTVAGLIATAFPSLLIILGVLVLGRNFGGTLSCGIAPILTPVAMAISVYVVIRRKNTVQEQLQKELEAKGLIQRGGDLL